MKENFEVSDQNIPQSAKDSKRFYLLLALIVIGIIYLYQHPEEPSQTGESSPSEGFSAEEGESGWVKNSFNDQNKKISESEDVITADKSTTETLSAGEEIVDKNDPKVQAFNYAVTEMQKCFESQKSLAVSKVWDSSEDSLAEILKPQMGEYSHQAIHWESTEIKTSDGQKRRIKVEEEIDEDGRRRRRLSYFNINSQGEAEPIQIPKDEKIMETLAREGEVIERMSEKSMVFSNGEEVLLKFKNEKIDSVEMNHMGIEFSCRDLQLTGLGGDGNYSCSCQNQNLSK